MLAVTLKIGDCFPKKDLIATWKKYNQVIQKIPESDVNYYYTISFMYRPEIPFYLIGLLCHQQKRNPLIQNLIPLPLRIAR